MVGIYFNISVFCERIGDLLVIYLPDLFSSETIIIQELFSYHWYDMESYEMLINTFNTEEIKKSTL